MKLECLTIVIIVGLLSIDFLRRGRKEYALCSFPLLILPFVHMASDLIGIYVISKLASSTVSQYTTAIVDGLAAITTIIAVILCQKLLKHKKSRFYYTVCCICYTCIIAAILVGYTMAH